MQSGRAWIAVLALVGGWVAAGAPSLAEPQRARMLESFRDWTVYVAEGDGGRICYIASEPKKQEGNYSRRGPTAVVVAKFPGDAGIQVSVQAGYPYKRGSLVEMVIDQKLRFDLVTDAENAFARNAKEDRTIIEAMKKGARMTVRGTSRKGTYSLDRYSLMGFTAAYRAMLEACKDG